MKQVHKGIKRTGHQSRAKRLMKEEAKRLEALKKQQSGGDVSAPSLADMLDGEKKIGVQPPRDHEQPSTSHQSDKNNTLHDIAAESVPPSSSGAGRGVPPMVIPLNLTYDRSGPPAAGAMQPLPPGQVPPHGSNPRSNFYTMVESLIQFSKEH